MYLYFWVWFPEHYGFQTHRKPGLLYPSKISLFYFATYISLIVSQLSSGLELQNAQGFQEASHLCIDATHLLSKVMILHDFRPYPGPVVKH